MSKTVMGIGDPFLFEDPFQGIGEFSVSDILFPLPSLLAKEAAGKIKSGEIELPSLPSLPSSSGRRAAPAAPPPEPSRWPWIAAAIGAGVVGFVVVRRVRRKKRGARRRGRK